MPISERKLKKWRKEALEEDKRLAEEPWHAIGSAMTLADYTKRVLELTQELLDQHLLKK